MALKDSIKRLKEDKTLRVRIITWITMLYNFFWGVFKVFVGIFRATYFFCVSGGTTLLIGTTKVIFHRHIDNDNEDIKIKKAKIISVLLMIVGMLFTIYMVKYFFYPDEHVFSTISSIALAAFSFGELGVAIYNIFKERKSSDPMMFALRSCNLVSALFAIVLTQIALLSAQGQQMAVGNGISGVVFGALAIIVGIISLVVSTKIEKKSKQAKNE